jgi:hypothetical protein
LALHPNFPQAACASVQSARDALSPIGSLRFARAARSVFAWCALTFVAACGAADGKIGDPGPQGVGIKAGVAATTGTGGATSRGGGGDSGVVGDPGTISSTSDDASDLPPFEAGPPPANPCIGTGGCPSGVWINVTPSAVNLTPNYSCSTCNYGVQDIVTDPARPNDLYAFICYQGVWKSTDYGQTWAKVSTGTNGSTLDKGRPWTAAIDPNVRRDPSTPPTLWTVSGYGTLPGVYRSTDGGVNWTHYTLGNTTALAAEGFSQAADDAYSLDVDPNDSNHIISGFHQAPGVSESTDGGQTWTTITVPSNIGQSLYVFFINTGNAATTRTTWLTVAQWNNNVNGIWRTTNSGGSWTQVQGKLEHLHGGSQIFQDGNGGIYASGEGTPQGVWRSTDYGVTWVAASANNVLQNAVFGTPTTIYAMSSGATQGTQPLHDQKAAIGNGASWSDWTPTSPSGMTNGPKRVAVTFDGTHHIMVSGNWLAGIWRYIE